jgi:nucleotide-binding universal stress UspA family protein
MSGRSWRINYFASSVVHAFILDLVKEWAADLIVAGSHGRGLDRLIMGSVSESVAIYAHCSVEVVRP